MALFFGWQVIGDVAVQHFGLRWSRDVNEYFSFHFAALIIDRLEIFMLNWNKQIRMCVRTTVSRDVVPSI